METSLSRLFDLMNQSDQEINQNILEIERSRNNFETPKDQVTNHFQLSFVELIFLTKLSIFRTY